MYRDLAGGHQEPLRGSLRDSISAWLAWNSSCAKSVTILPRKNAFEKSAPIVRHKANKMAQVQTKNMQATDGKHTDKSKKHGHVNPK